MSCYYPKDGYLSRFGGWTQNRGDAFIDKPLTIPCGGCIGCRIDRARQWTARLLHEAQGHDANCVVTLTYADMPAGGSLDVRDWQLFAKRLRRRLGPTRFYAVGEYGDLGRPHFHAVLFGQDFSGDRRRKPGTHKGGARFESRLLDEIWGHGRTEIGQLDSASVAYVAGYLLPKWDTAAEANQGRRRPFAVMSRRPGIGSSWADYFHAQVATGEVHLNGKPVAIPKLYQSKLEERDPEAFQAFRAKRIAYAAAHPTTRERRETVAEVKRLKAKSARRDLDSASIQRQPQFPSPPPVSSDPVNSLAPIISTTSDYKTKLLNAQRQKFRHIFSRPKATPRATQFRVVRQADGRGGKGGTTRP